MKDYFENIDKLQTVEHFGLWDDFNNRWFAPYDAGLFWTTSPSVAMANLQIQMRRAESYSGTSAEWRVRSFDEWAKSEGLTE